MSKKVVVLGGGLVGSTVAIELSKQYNVTVVDQSDNALTKLKRCFGINCQKCDVLDRKKMEQLLEPFDLVVGAMPGAISFEVMKRVIDAGKNMVDFSFTPEDPLELDDRAKHKKVSIIVDCGLAPGISNMILGYHTTNMKVDKYECYVGALPFEREWPWEYKAGFSPADVIEEYIRPARYMENGKQVTKEALSDPELIFFKGIGSLEAWNSDGLRTMLKTMKVPNMIEKTLRYPGTIQFLRALIKSGFFSQRTVEIEGNPIRPIDLTTKLLMPMWELKQGDEDFSLLRAKVQGYEDKEWAAYEYTLFDKYDQKSGIHSVSRCSGYTCSAVAELLLTEKITKHGIIPPEILAQEKGIFTTLVNYLETRGISLCIDKVV